MLNLRLISFSVIDNTTLSARFNYSLNKSIGVNNIIITSDSNGVEDPSVTGVSIINDTITIYTQPTISKATYFISFISTETILFKSLNGDAIILNDSITNKHFFIGPVDPDNIIKSSINNLLKNNVYDLENPSIISKYIDNLSLYLSRALYNIGQTKNNNYLSFTVKDELKTRGDGAYDRLNQEGAYEIMRVAKTPTGKGISETITISDFPSYPVSLLSSNILESISVSNTDVIGSFNLKTLTINCSNSPAIILNSIRFIYNSILAPFDYDISTYGYQVKESIYDPNYAFTYVSLDNNQFRLNNQVLSNSLFSLENIASITIDYQYKDLGKTISSSTLTLDTVILLGRESVPSIENIFNLKKAPVVKSNNLDGEVGDIIFIDPNAYPGSNTTHPAFVYEVPFRLDYMPSKIGEYSVDYPTGTVYVFGDGYNSGTGPYPPLATYNYRYTFKPEIDYIYDEINYDIVSLTNGNLNNSSANISYNFEKTLIKNIDYKCEVHKEELSERIENRLLALNTISPLNFPITNVFRIFNETSGEIYNISRWNDNKIFFNYKTPPKILNISNEKVNFESIINETLFISSTTQISLTKKLYKIYLFNNNIISASEDSIAHSNNSSLSFSDTTIFTSEFYYDIDLSEDQNTIKLTNIGEYQVNYIDGIIYLLVSDNQDLSIGTASYKRGYIQSEHPHLLTINDIYCKLNVLDEKVKNFNYISFDDALILPESFERSDENCLNKNTSLPYQLYNSIIGVFESTIFIPGVSDYIKYIRGIFERDDLLNNPSPINFSSLSTFNGKTIAVSSIEYREYQSVKLDGLNLIVSSNIDLLYLSNNITISASIIRLSDSAELWNGAGTIVSGSPFTFILPGINSPVLGDSVLLTYNFTINNLSRVIVDYNRGDYLIDYNYLADEIIISYEYGDNVIDFSKSLTVEPKDNYYVSYKAGALRNALLNNFGTLIDIPILNNLNIDFNRERYRDALIAAMQSFTAGPTISSLYNIVKGITHIPPEIEESSFKNWSLGNSLLTQEKIKSSENFELMPGKFGNGVLVSEPGQYINFPIISNLKLEEGTIGMWIVPQWNGIDNKALLEFEIIKDGYFVNHDAIDGYNISDQKIFIGPNENHPEVKNGIFSINSIDVGIPNKNKDGIYIYMSPDNSGLFNRWYVDIVDGYSDGYIATSTKIKINTNGIFYDIKSSPESISSCGKITSGTNSIIWKVSDFTSINEGITFTADYEHYLFDFGEPLLKNIKNNNQKINSIITELGESLLTNLNELLTL